MTILDILNYPNPRLHKIASNVEKVDNKIKTIIKDMFILTKKDKTIKYVHLFRD